MDPKELAAKINDFYAALTLPDEVRNKLIDEHLYDILGILVPRKERVADILAE